MSRPYWRFMVTVSDSTSRFKGLSLMTSSLALRRGAAMIMFKAVGVDPVSNYTRDVKKGVARWDAYLHVAGPDGIGGRVLVAQCLVFCTIQRSRCWLAWIRTQRR